MFDCHLCVRSFGYQQDLKIHLLFAHFFLTPECKVHNQDAELHKRRNVTRFINYRRYGLVPYRFNMFWDRIEGNDAWEYNTRLYARRNYKKYYYRKKAKLSKEEFSEYLRKNRSRKPVNNS